MLTAEKRTELEVLRKHGRSGAGACYQVVAQYGAVISA
jgi:hypothetical protein